MQISGIGQNSHAAMLQQLRQQQVVRQQSGQVSQLAQITSSYSSSSSLNVSTSVTSTDPTLLAQQQHNLTSQLTQLQSQNGNPKQIQQIQQAIQTIKNRIQQHEQLATESQASNQPSPNAEGNQNILLSNNSSRVIDIKA